MNEHFKAKDYESAYRLVLDKEKGDDMHFLRKIFQTRPVTSSLEKQTSRNVLAKLNKIVRGGIFESIEAKFGAEAVKNIFNKFGGFHIPTPFVETYPLLVSSDSDDTSDDDSLGCSHDGKIL